MAGHVTSTDLLNNLYIRDNGAMTLSGLSNSAIKSTNETVVSAQILRYVVKLNILPKYNHKILTVKTYTFIRVSPSNSLTIQQISRKKIIL
jgi:hypothetical protein